MYDDTPSNDIDKSSNVVHVHIQEMTDKAQRTVDKTIVKKNFWQRLFAKHEDVSSNEKTSLRCLFRFATCVDFIYLFLAMMASATLGLTIPLSMIIFGDSIDSFTKQTLDLCSINLTVLAQTYCPPNITLTSTNFYTASTVCNLTGSNIDALASDTNYRTRSQMIYLIILGCIALVCGYMRTLFLNLLSDRQIQIIRHRLFQSILEKDIEYFDRYQTGELSTCLTENVNKIQDGIGIKLGTAIEILATFLSCVIIGFVRGWKLTLIVLSMLPIIFFAILLSNKIIGKMISRELQAYGKAGIVAEEVISAIRTVFCYNGQEREIRRYEENLDVARNSGIKRSAIDGITNGFILLLIYCTFALGFWYGGKLVREENYTIGAVFTIFMGIYMGVLSLEQASPFFQAITQARVAAYFIWKIIDEPIKINAINEKSLTKDYLDGNIQFSRVHFSYPSRFDVPVLNGVNFNVKRGQTVALVGSSGSGKSTCVQLLQRFYDYQSGSILLDGEKLQQYDLKWLRQQIAVVGQEPILFQTTIRQNILLGNDSASEEDVHRAAKMANAHDFIMNLPDKYETLVGERGTTLSGGQKQRIAIARALIRNPRILLLDEATSALDNESEKIVQEALERASEGRTTLIIAHRLSTIRYADKIIVLHKGRVVEQGTHDSLMQARGAYYTLVEKQNAYHEEEKNTNKDEDNQAVSNERKNSNIQMRRSSTLNSRIMSLWNPLSRRSTSIEIQHVDKSIEPKEGSKPNTSWEILKMNRPEWISILIGCLAALINGALEPTSAIVQTKLVTAFQDCDTNIQQQQVRVCSFIYLGFGLCGLIVQSLQIFMFSWSGEALTKRLRSKTFRAILRQDIAYFDQAQHNTGTLCTYLATEASAVQGASGVRIGIIIQNIVTVGVGILIGFAFSWQLTLLIIAFLPLIIFGAMIQSQLITKFAESDQENLENAGKIVVEAIQNIRTVTQLSKEDYFYQEYCRLLDSVYQSSGVRLQILSGLYAVTSAVFFFAMAALIFLGAKLINQGAITFTDFFMVFDSIALAARIASQTLTLSPDYGKAIKAAEKIFQLLNQQPTIDNCSDIGEKIPNFSGHLQFHNVYFMYPNRPQATILKGLQLDIKAGQKIAIVGSSGCGKSTLLQLIERFYDTNSGQLFVDSKDIRNLNLHWYRSQIGIVLQEPILFDMSIRENIAYGDTHRDVISMEEIIEAAKNANIHDFIQALPDKYETNCGAKGIQLSGGQKQRIAIARALIRNPKILLFDEATSALDSESEQIVQEALDRAQLNRTSITIAHRLSTIQSADLICVLHDGILMESGTHEELLARRGRYYQLVIGKQD